MHPVCVGRILQVVFVRLLRHYAWNWQQNWFESWFHWVCQHHFFSITSAACECGAKNKLPTMLSSNVQSIDLPINCMVWWFWTMRQLNGCSSLTPRSSTAKQWIERTESNNEEDFFNFLVACSTLFPTRQNFDWFAFSVLRPLQQSPRGKVRNLRPVDHMQPTRAHTWIIHCLCWINQWRKRRGGESPPLKKFRAHFDIQASASCSKILNATSIFNKVKNSGQLYFSGQAKVVQNSEW